MERISSFMAWQLNGRISSFVTGSPNGAYPLVCNGQMEQYFLIYGWQFQAYFLIWPDSPHGAYFLILWPVVQMETCLFIYGATVHMLPLLILLGGSHDAYFSFYVQRSKWSVSFHL
ncbi:hypothetical protein AVEN_235883-1 [Araneus ventricosus]|uniref:Uncharacterized protein n=1 Tax=Araneus ventricosus TaxID=182803 RepID=A0A4Y2R0M0_ARAVE|nr:hypothetical protein AVEN_235883-1 [Araneus ventricosus]